MDEHTDGQKNDSQKNGSQVNDSQVNDSRVNDTQVNDSRDQSGFPPPSVFDEPTDRTPPMVLGDTSDASPHRHKRRFLAGVATGLVVAAVAVGTVVVIDQIGDDDSATAVGAGAPITLAAEGSSLHALVMQARPSIVAIHTTVTQTDMYGRDFLGEAAGTGWVVSADGYITTNAHVVEDSKSISVTLGDGETEEAELVASDPRVDLAVLRIDRDDLVPLPLGDSGALNVGDSVVAIGNALDLGAEPTVTGGIVSAKDRTIVDPSGQTLVDLIQTDAAINLGNSGGPLLDLQGRVVGINTAVSGRGENIGFAIAIDRAKTMIQQLQNGEVPLHALLGVTTQAVSTVDEVESSNDPEDDDTGDDDTGDDDTGDNDSLSPTGAQIVSIQPGSGADDAELQVDDVILSVDDETITSPRDLVAAIARREPGDVVTVTVGRDGEMIPIEVTLGAHDNTTS